MILPMGVKFDVVTGSYCEIVPAVVDCQLQSAISVEYRLQTKPLDGNTRELKHGSLRRDR